MLFPIISRTLAVSDNLIDAVSRFLLNIYWSNCNSGAIGYNTIDVTRSSISFAALASWKGNRWPYRSRVVLALECPKRRLTTIGGISLLSIRLADVCRRSWNLIFGNPAASRSPWKTRYKWLPFSEALLRSWTLTLDRATYYQLPSVIIAGAHNDHEGLGLFFHQGLLSAYHLCPIMYTRNWFSCFSSRIFVVEGASRVKRSLVCLMNPQKMCQLAISFYDNSKWVYQFILMGIK